jgi:carbamoyl-phosphate synthase large subunit
MEVCRKKKSIRMLFLGGARRISLAERFLDAAKRLNMEMTFYSYELNQYVPIASVAEIIVGLKWDDPKILEDLSEVIKKLSINIIIPSLDPATLIAAQLKERFADVFIPVSSYNDCDTFFDKQKANTWFIENRFQIPEINNALPFIAKPKGGSASKGIIVVASEMEKTFFYEKYDASDYAIQRFINGEEYTIDCYVSMKRHILCVVPRKRIEVVSGEATRTITIRDEGIVELSRNILEKSKLIGPITIQCIKEMSTGNIFFIEINPRFGGGVICAIEAGADIPYLLLCDYSGNYLEPISNWQENVLMTRCYRETFFYANNN